MCKVGRVILVGVVVLSVLPTSAQVTDPIEGVAVTLERIDDMVLSGESSELLSDVALVPVQEQASDGVDAWGDAQKRSHAAQSGLELRAGYDMKFGEGTDDIYDDLYSYRNRFHMMLSWDILSSGLVGKKALAERVEVEKMQMMLRTSSSQGVEVIYAQGALQEQILDGYLNNIFNTQMDLYASLINLLDTLQMQGQSTTMECSEMRLQAEMTRGLFRETPVSVDKLLDMGQYLSQQSVVDAQMVQSLIDSSMAVENSRLNEQLLSCEAKELSYWRTVSVSPYIKAQQYSDAYFKSSRVTANIGISATLPIFSGMKSKRAEISARSKLVANETSQIASSLLVNVGDVALSLNRNLEQLTANVLLEELCRKQIDNAMEAYSHKQLPMQDLAKYYLKLLDLHSDIIRQIKVREALKVKLILATI